MTRSSEDNNNNENYNNNNNEKQQPTRKRIRDNHNELERARRNNQKAQLEALRLALPFQDMDEKASMVSIFIRAREYIGMLEQRIVELQTASSGTIPSDAYFAQMATNMSPKPQSIQIPLIFQQQNPQQNLQQNLQQNPQHILPSQQQSPQQLPTQRERNPSVNPDHIQIHHGIPFYNPGFLPPQGSTEESNNLLSSISSSPTTLNIRKPSSPLSDRNSTSDALFNADLLHSFVSDSFIKSGGIKRLSSHEEDVFMRGFAQRRSSTLLLPVDGNSVMVQKRDSLSALFSGLLPDIVDSSSLNSNNIKCSECQKGMSNMIMIDCDKCHKWYHIKCAHIDSNAIPTFWNCC